MRQYIDINIIVYTSQPKDDKVFNLKRSNGPLIVIKVPIQTGNWYRGNTLILRPVEDLAGFK